MGKWCFKMSVLLMLASISASLPAKDPVPDSLLLSGLIPYPVQHSVSDQNGGWWIVAGDSCQSLFHVNQNHRVKRFPSLLRKYPCLHVTNLVCLKKDMVLIGTHGHYLFCLHDKRLMQFNFKNGLSDSVVTSILMDTVRNSVIVQGLEKRFVFDYQGEKDHFRFREVSSPFNDRGDEVDKVGHRFRRAIQKAVCDVFGDVDFSFRNRKLVTSRHLSHIKKTLAPGDVLVKRNDFQLSNVVIPGFWTHAAIYIGSLKELNEYFPESSIPGGISASEYIRKNHYTVYQKLKGHPHMIIEAVAQGVTINHIGHVARVDHFAALRPLMDKEHLFKALVRSFQYYDLPYDYLFDMKSDEALICSELIYKSYQGDLSSGFISFRVGMRDGQPFLSPTDIVMQSIEDQKRGNPSFQFVLFCGSPGKRKKADFQTFDEFERVSFSN